MKIAVLGTGMVGQSIGTKLVELGHEVTMGSRSADNAKAREWASATGGKVATFNDAADGSDVLFNCTNGQNSIAAISSIDQSRREGKVLIDVANELAVQGDKPGSLASATNSLGAKLQAAFPEMKVVKSLNTLNCSIMVDPSLVPGSHNIFMSGDDAAAKTTVRTILESFGWKPDAILDLGGIESAVGPEMFMSLWLNIFLSGNGGEHATFNIAVVK